MFSLCAGICDKDCATIEVEEHTECKCACALSPADCPLPAHLQHFVAADCACRCLDTAARRACLDAPGRLWDDGLCSCACALRAQDCEAGGHRLDPVSCTCQEMELSSQHEVRRISI